MIEVTINGMFQTDKGQSGVILKEQRGDRTLPIVIGEHEAQAIALGMEGIAPPRPLAYDLLINTIEALGGEIHRVIISDVRKETYFAVLQIARPEPGGVETIFDIDARPSDVLAVAVRREIPIFVETDVLERASNL